MNRSALLATLAACTLSGCGSEAPPPPAAAPAATPVSDAERYAAPIERAHGREAWLAQPALASHIEVDYGGETVLTGEMLFTTSMSRSRIDTAAGPSVIWDGETAWVSPGDAELPMARFHVLTWPYFVLAPLKLRDPGTRLEPLGEQQVGERSFETARLSFAPGVGDTPDDWYVLYQDPDSSRLHAMAYIVTFGTTTDQAEQEPHAIVYRELSELEGARIPTRMQFHRWSEAEGIHGDPIGELRISDPRFATPDAGAFDVPEGAREAPLPRSGSQAG
jgi:hypothetical protein